ncbi:MAG: oxygen-independent coproporphyrinogen-3 oxidase [Alphaproteobacteria bacterium]
MTYIIARKIQSRDDPVMISDLIERYDRRVPRYTSYPTAPHFSPNVTAARYKDWLSGLDPDAPISLYLHIPFCQEMCWYCGCNTRATRRHRPVAAYQQRLLQEIHLAADALPAHINVSHVHFGGGSPNMLTPTEFATILASIRSRFNFTDAAEIAVEIDPRTTSDAFIDACATSGVTRLSLGVQDLNEAVQKAVNRVQSFEKISTIAARAKQGGIVDINIDLMYGLPGQTTDNVLKTMGRVLSLAPSRLALFGYAHVPWMKPHMRLIDEAALPDAEARWAQSTAASEYLRAHGYRQIGMDHFARNDTPLAHAAQRGTLRRNFQGYTTDEATTLIGLGASSIGQTPQGYAQNDPDVRRWSAAIESGAFATVKGCTTGPDDHMRRDIIERLMCDMEVDAAAVATEHGFQRADIQASLDALTPMARDDLLNLDGATVRMTEKGKPLVRAAAAAFDQYLSLSKHDSPRHAHAV